MNTAEPGNTIIQPKDKIPIFDSITVTGCRPRNGPTEHDVNERGADN
jgi:hypothetical protein